MKDNDGTRIEGIFEVRWHPITCPDEVKLRRGFADQALDSWYVVIDNGSRLDESGQWSHEWGYGVSWFHPDPNRQCTASGTFDQHLMPVDDEARKIVLFVKNANAKGLP